MSGRFHAVRARRSGALGALVALSALGVSAFAAGCASAGRFPLREPVLRDPDLAPVAVPCRKDPTEKEPNHVSCTPKEYVSPLAWDAAHNSVFRPLSHAFKFDPGGEAANANSLDEVADSAWFTNRVGVRAMPMDEVVRGACTPELMLDGENVADASWLVDHGKDNGSSPGFRVNIPGKGKYMFKADGDEQPERPSAASVIGAAAYHITGFNTSCEQVVYFKPSALKLKPGLTVTDNTGITKPFDQKALERVLALGPKRGALVRMQASSWLPGKLLGPFRYEGTRADDPHDKIPHEDRRDLRGGRLLAAWIDHFDAREQNSMDSWIAVNKKESESSPGFVRHYYLDTSDCFGSEWAWDEVSRRLGHSYLLDWGDVSTDFVTFGVIEHPWDRAQRTKGQEIFGYFTTKDFDPSKWKNEYPNPTFSRMTEKDGAWMTRILAHVTPEMVRGLVEMGKFTDQRRTDYLVGVLQGRLDAILGRYLTRLSPISDVRVEGDKLCGLDLARFRHLGSPDKYRYAATLGARADDRGRALPVEVGAEGKVCVALPHAGGDVEPASAPYVVVRITNRAGTGPLEVHLYDLGPKKGFRLAGIDRPNP